MRKVIVSGAGGFIGRALVSELLKHGIEVIALVRDKDNHNLEEHENLKVYSFSLDKAALLEESLSERDVDTFFHLAWAGSAGKDRADAQLQLNNAVWAGDCVRLAKSLGCSRFINAGSIMETETIKAELKDENKPGLSYIYGTGKLAAHMICKSVAAAIDIDFICAIITNAYGEGEISPRLVNTTIQKCIRQEPPQFTAATQNYDFVHIDDVARAFRLIGENGKPFTDYLIGSSNAKPLKEFLLEMQDSISPNLKFEFGSVPFTGINLELEDFNCQKTELDTGFKARISFAEGCKRTRDWLLKVKEKNNESEI